MSSWLNILVLCFLSVSSYDRKTLEYLLSHRYMESWVLQRQQIMPSDLENLMSRALKKCQTSLGLEATGKLNSETNDTINHFLCNQEKDFSLSRKKRFSLYRTKWDKQELTFNVSRYSDKVRLLRPAIDEVVEQVFAAWAEKTTLLFRPSASQADITIQFVSGNRPVFKNGTFFAMASYPPKGIVYVNEDYGSWSTRNHSGKELFKALMHEVGHALGLQHSDVPGSIMQPFIKLNYDPDFTLHDDDVRGIQALYGNRTKIAPDLCLNSSFDAIFEYPNGVIYVLKGDYYWKLVTDGIASGYPRLISHRWPGLPGNVDAATATSSGVTYFFKGSRSWIYQDTTPCNSNPYYISVKWPGIPDNLDAVTWHGGSLFYFYKGDVYWQYNTMRLPHVSKALRRPMPDWIGFDSNLNDALYVNSGYIYFFTRESYYCYNCKTDLIDYGSNHEPDYPRSTRHWWFRCK